MNNDSYTTTIKFRDLEEALMFWMSVFFIGIGMIIGAIPGLFLGPISSLLAAIFSVILMALSLIMRRIINRKLDRLASSK